jgi:hypothetical protein
VLAVPPDDSPQSVGAVITVEGLEGLYTVIEKQRSQLTLAFCLLAELGFELGDFMDALS